jgi:hypothetical protein
VRLSKKFAALAITAAVALTGTAALAYWTTSGSGEGSADAAAGQVDNLGFVTDPIADMYPGDDSQSLSVAVTNNHATQNAYVTSVKAYLTVEPAVVGGVCGAGDFLLNGSPAPGTAALAATLTWSAQDLDPAETADATGTIQFNNLGSNQDDCKSAAVTLHYIAS